MPECIETFVPEAKSSGARVFFRRRKDPAKTAASKQQSPVNGGATTLPKAGSGGGGDAADQLASLKSALLAGGGTKAASAVDDAIVRDRVQALGLDFFRDDFEGVTVAKTKCLECETCTEQKETMIDIAIPITASEVSDAAKNPQLFYQVRIEGVVCRHRSYEQSRTNKDDYCNRSVQLLAYGDDIDIIVRDQETVLDKVNEFVYADNDTSLEIQTRIHAAKYVYFGIRTSDRVPGLLSRSRSRIQCGREKLN